MRASLKASSLSLPSLMYEKNLSVSKLVDSSSTLHKLNITLRAPAYYYKTLPSEPVKTLSPQLEAEGLRQFYE